MKGNGTLALLVTGFALGLPGCGWGESDQPASGLEEQVAEAMEELPYAYDILENRSTDGYVVFRANDAVASVNIAYGGKSREGSCSRPPTLPVPHRIGGKPFAAASGLICLEDDSWRPGATEAQAVARGNIVNHTSTALCEVVYGEWACFD